MENNENKRMYIVIAILASIFVIALLSIIINNIKLNKKLNTIYDAIESNEYKAVYVMRNNCSYCNLFETSINENEELGYNYIKIDLNDLNENQLSKLAYKLNLGALDKNTYNILKSYIEELNLNNEEKNEYLNIVSQNYISEENNNKISALFKDSEKYETVLDILENIGAYSTPTTVIIGKGGVVDSLVGYTNPQVLNNFLKEYNLVDTNKTLKFNYPTNLEEYNKLINSNEKEVIVLAKSTCSYCVTLHENLSRLLETNNVKISYVYLDSIIKSQEDQDKFYESLPWLTEKDGNGKENFSGTPTTIIVQNKKVLASIGGSVSEQSFKTFLQNNGIME